MDKEVTFAEHSGAQSRGIQALLLLLSHFSCVQLVATPWTAAYQAPPSMGFFQARVLEWGAIAFKHWAKPFRHLLWPLNQHDEGGTSLIPILLMKRLRSKKGK